MEQQHNTLVCPICQHHNAPEARRCAQCGVSLMGNTTTMRVSDEQVDEVMGELGFTPPTHREAAAEGLVFYIAGEVQPVIMRGREEVILGRHVAEGPPPADLVDLGTYHGHLLGVSRQHARVRLSGDECVLEDLNSTNGTWLNEKRLTANTAYILNNGDQVRLGQLILFVYFSMTSSRQKVKLGLSGSAASVVHRPPIMGLHLARETATYLQALVELQRAIDTIQGRSADEKRDIPLLEVDGEQASVDLTLVGLADAVNVVQQVIMPWQKEHVWLLAALWKGAAPEDAIAADAPPDAIPQKPDTSPLGGLGEAPPPSEEPTALDVSPLTGGTSDLALSDHAGPEGGVISPDDAAPSTRDLDAEEAASAPEPDEPLTEPEAAVPPEAVVLPDAEKISPFTEAISDSGADTAPEGPDAAVGPVGKATEPAPEPAQDVTLDTLRLALQKRVLEHVTAGFGAASSRDQAHLVLLEEPVEVLSRSTLEVTASSY